jgi:hypothetical protein
MSLSQPILEDFLTKEELAAELHRNPRTLDRWEVLGIGPPRTFVGRKILYRRMSVQKWLAAQENHSTGNVAAVERSGCRGPTLSASTTSTEALIR